MNLVLIGYRGAGKSTVGRLVAERLGLNTLGFDAEIVRRAGKSIPEIVRDEGWERFRDLESALVRESVSLDGWLFDTGGGVVERPENVALLRRCGPVVWLRADVETIVRRIGGDDQRPSLTGARSFTDEVAQVLARRTPLYSAAADREVDTSRLTVDEAVTAIVGPLRQEP